VRTIAYRAAERDSAATELLFEIPRTAALEATTGQEDLADSVGARRSADCGRWNRGTVCGTGRY
jgi:hypothetical protein